MSINPVYTSSEYQTVERKLNNLNETEKGSQIVLLNIEYLLHIKSLKQLAENLKWSRN